MAPRLTERLLLRLHLGLDGDVQGGRNFDGPTELFFVLYANESSARCASRWQQLNRALFKR